MSKSKDVNADKAIKPIDELTPEEKAKFETWVNQRSATVKVELSKDGNSITLDGGDTHERANYKLIETLGASDLDAAEALLVQVSGLTMLKNGDAPNPKEINKLLALLGGIKPTDNIEGMLAAQMVAVHTMAMNCSQMALMTERTFKSREMNFNQLVKLMRTYTTQMESLNKYRGKGQQKMTVEHVQVNEGGQAIIGNVEGGKDGNGK